MKSEDEAQPFRPHRRALAGLAVVITGSAWLFFDTIEDISSDDPLLLMDAHTYHGLQALRSPAVDTLMVAVTELGDTPVVVAVAGAVAAWLIRAKAWRGLSYWLLAIVGGSAINTAIKMALQRARPSDLHYTGWSTFSFPSGHSTTNAVLYGFLALMIVREAPKSWRMPVVLGAATLVAAIAFSRLYLGAHWLSDVMGGLGFGMVWLSGLGFFYLLRRSEAIEPIKMQGVAMAALVLAGGVNIAVNHADDRQRYTHRPGASPRDGLPVIPAPAVLLPNR